MNCNCCAVTVCSKTFATASTLTYRLLRHLFAAWRVLLSCALINPQEVLSAALGCIIHRDVAGSPAIYLRMQEARGGLERHFGLSESALVLGLA